MIGILLWKEPQRGLRQRPVTLAERNILHMRFLCAEITRGLRTLEAALGWRVSSAARRMRKMGVTRAVLPEGFAYGAQLEKQGLRPVSTLALRRRLAADWVRQALAEGMSQLSADHRQALALRELHELSYEEIAAVLEVDLGTVKSRISRARGALRKILLKNGNLSGYLPSKPTENAGKGGGRS